MSRSKQPERRTFLQDRLEILINKQRSGKATFNELTELDQIVNSDPEIRQRIIVESMLIDDMGDTNDPLNHHMHEEISYIPPAKTQGLLGRIKSFLSRIFNAQISIIKIKLLTNAGNAILV